MGLEEETKTVIGYLTEETEELDVIPIVGMRGIGKTTLAWKTFNSDEAIREFPTRIWINVSDEFNEEEVLLAILKHFTKQHMTKDINEFELPKLVASYLRREKFLIVMDDVCSAYDWDRLRIALPQSSKNGKILITSCDENVVRHDERTRLPSKVGFLTRDESWTLLRPERDERIRLPSKVGFLTRDESWTLLRPERDERIRLPLKVGFLTRDESWSLLRSEVFGDHKCPPELEYIGQVIVEQCCGLPLAIMDMARTLLEEDLSCTNMKERRIAWTKVSSRVPRHLSNIRYRSLTYQTRLCFLYFGMFPEGYDIPVWKLISMWIAEGFIQQGGSMSLEETAEIYLEDLISKNLVITGRIKSSGKPKTCRIHPMLHEFCRIEAGNQRGNFLQQIEFSDGDFHPPISDLSSYHRLSISSNIVLNFLSSKPFGPRVHSLLCFGPDQDIPTHYSSVIPAGFKQLRVLDVMPIRLTKITSDMYELKFLALSVLDCKILPAEISQLCNLQTLIVYTTSRTLEIGEDIWQLTQLRHLKTNASATLVMTERTGYYGRLQNLHTLAMVSPESFTRESDFKFRNLKKLGIRGKLSSFFDNYENWLGLSDLDNLKLVNDVYPLPASSGKLHSLPPPSNFPQRLRSLTLAQTYLDWSEMDILGELHTLEVLKLKDHAFIGLKWATEDGGFKNLQVLHIDHTDLVIWEASAHQFPSLISLKLHYCKDLQEIPIQLADIPNFQCLELRDTNLAAASAIMIRYKIKNNRYQKGPSRNHEEFKLSIYPLIK